MELKEIKEIIDRHQEEHPYHSVSCQCMETLIHDIAEELDLLPPVDDYYGMGYLQWMGSKRYKTRRKIIFILRVLIRGS